jgi:hypothetical protein
VPPVMTEMTDEDLLFDLELRVVPLDVTDDSGLASGGSAVHTSYVTEGITVFPRCTYGCSYTCQHAPGDQNMCL